MKRVVKGTNQRVAEEIVLGERRQVTVTGFCAAEIGDAD